MQALPLPTISAYSIFQQPRPRESLPGFPVDWRLLDVDKKPSGALPPSPPMSRSSVPGTPSEPFQGSGRRRKRSESPPATQPLVSVPEPYHQTPTFPPASWPDPQRGQYYPPTLNQFAPQLPSAFPGQPSFTLPSFGESLAATPGVAGGEITSGVGSLAEEDPSRATKKPKAHVASACVNCKKKHLRCDNARPCRRCIQAGKEVSSDSRDRGHQTKAL